MPEANTRGPLRAVLSLSGGVYRAEYPGELNPENPDERVLPDSHIGNNPDDVRSWVEQMAEALGYTRVEWDDPQAG